MSTAQQTSGSETIQVTDKAIEQIREIQSREKLDGHVLRVSVAGGGCSGTGWRWLRDFGRSSKAPLLRASAPVPSVAARSTPLRN